MSTLFRGSLICLCGLFIGSGLRLGAQPVTCSDPLTEKQKTTVTKYVRQKYNLPDTVALSLKKDTAVADACFRELVFEGTSSFKTWELTLYASPDARFLS